MKTTIAKATTTATRRSPVLKRSIAAVLAAIAFAAGAQPTAPPAPKVFELALASGRVSDRGDTIRVRRYDRVELRWSSDKPIALHLHGYDIEVSVTPPTPAVMAFAATIAGRFPVSEHRHGGGHERAVLYLEVHP